MPCARHVRSEIMFPRFPGVHINPEKKTVYRGRQKHFSPDFSPHTAVSKATKFIPTIGCYQERTVNSVC